MRDKAMSQEEAIAASFRREALEVSMCVCVKEGVGKGEGYIGNRLYRCVFLISLFRHALLLFVYNLYASLSITPGVLGLSVIRLMC